MKRADFVEFMRNVKTPQIIEFKHAATPSMRETDNPYLGALKHQHVTALVNFNYEGLTNKEMPEGYKNFQAGARPWGVRVPNCPLVENKGEFYLETVVRDTLSPVRYTLAGQIIPIGAIEPFLKIKPESHETLVRPRDFRVSGIEWIKIDGNGFNITD